MDNSVKFTDIVKYYPDEEFSRTTLGDKEAYDYGYALWAFAQAWKGGALPPESPTLLDIPAYDSTYFGTDGYVSYNRLFQMLDEWCLYNYNGNLESKFPDLSTFFHNVANRWYINSGLGVEEVPQADYFDQMDGYEKSFLNPRVYCVIPPFFYKYSNVIQVGVGSIVISNDILVPLQRRGIDGSVYLIDTYPDNLTVSYPVTMYRLLQLLLGHLTYEGRLHDEQSRNLGVDFANIKRLLFIGSPKMLSWEPTDIAHASTIRTRQIPEMNSNFSPVLLDKTLEYVRYIKSELIAAQSSAGKKTKKRSK